MNKKLRNFLDDALTVICWLGIPAVMVWVFSKCLRRMNPIKYLRTFATDAANVA